MTRKHDRAWYIPEGATKIQAKGVPAVFYVRTAVGGVVYGMAFLGKAQKPSWHYRFRSMASFEAEVRKSIEAMTARADYHAKRKAESAAFVHRVTAGDIFRTSWGYDQTNVEFFEVVEVRGKMAVLREIAAASADNGAGSERCVPQSGAFCGEPIRRLIQAGSIKIDDVRRAWPWGERVAGVVVGPAARRTAVGWGH